MTFLVFFSGWQFILIPAEVKRTSATLCRYNFLSFSILRFFGALRLRVCRCFRFWDPTGSLLDAGLSFWHRRGSFWDSLGPVWQTILRWQACFLFFKKSQTRVHFCDRPKTYTRFLITYSSWFLGCLFLLLLLPLLLAPLLESSLGLLS